MIMTNSYLAANITENMWQDMIETGKFMINPESVTIEDLKKEPDLICCIKNRGLIGTLKQLGVKIGEQPLASVHLDSEDVLYVVSSVGNIKLRNYMDFEELPKFVKLRVTKYTLLEK